MHQADERVRDLFGEIQPVLGGDDDPADDDTAPGKCGCQGGHQFGGLALHTLSAAAIMTAEN